MKNTKIISVGDICRWKPAKRRECAGFKISRAFKNPQRMLWAIVIFASVSYLYAINKTAVLGFEYRSVEKRVSELRQENEQLRIKEAELKSLYRIEEASRNLQMVEYQNLSYLEDHGVMALR